MQRYLTYLKAVFRYGLYQLAQLSKHPPGLGLPRLTQLKIEQPYRVDLGHPERVVILLVGCGGTGSWVSHILAQLAYWAKSAGLDLRLYFVDHDKVEAKNLVRQNFCPAEVGYPKAFSLAWRYSAAFGLQITPVVERFSAELLDRYRPGHAPGGTLTIVIGAVDNAGTRRQIAGAIAARQYGDRRHRIWWLDSGNERTGGQILAGNSLESEPLLSPLGYCLALPLPHIQEPGLLVERDRPPQTEDLSCAELTALAEQGAMINQAMATWIGTYLYRLLQSRDLTMQATWVNQQVGSVRSDLITKGRVVFPERPQLRPPTAGDLAEVEAGDMLICPECGGELIRGRDEWHGILVDVYFCANCSFRVEACPECGAELVEDEITDAAEALIPAISCTACEWFEPIRPLAGAESDI